MPRNEPNREPRKRRGVIKCAEYDPRENSEEKEDKEGGRMPKRRIVASSAMSKFYMRV